jgi:hypothetical protein
MDSILFKVIVIAVLVGLLALITIDDRRSRRLREEEARARAELSGQPRSPDQRGDSSS